MFRKLPQAHGEVLEARGSPLRSQRFLPYYLGCAFWLASLALFWRPLHSLVLLCLDDARYTHLLLIPVISAYFLYRERHAISSRIKFHPWTALPYLVAAFAMYGLLVLRVVRPSSNYVLPAVMLMAVLVWLAAFAACFGVAAFRSAQFPLLFLLLLVPVPLNLMDQIISFLQRGSAEATYALFQLFRVPVFRSGVTFELPGVGIEIAKECSAIHSGWALFITGLILSHVFLKSIWTKASLSILTVPIAMLTNAVRIVTLWFLGTHVDMGFLTGNLHHHGGILFSVISLSILSACLYILHKMEQELAPRVNPC